MRVFSGKFNSAFAKNSIYTFPENVIPLQVVISLKLKVSFGFSFTEQRDADEEETGDGKRGITYEVKKPRISTSFHFFSFMLVLNFFEYVTFWCRFLRTRVLRPRRRRNFVTLV